MAGFTLGKKSRSELEGVHADLVKVVELALSLTPQDFAVHDGIRTLEEQKKLVAAGASQTLNSRHISGHAVDLVPVINDKLRWEWEPIYKIADAVRTAAKQLGVPIRWGGAWHVLLTDTEAPVANVLADYVNTRRAEGKPAFTDGPHFELPADKYP